MTVSQKVLIAPKQLENSQTTQYTTPTGAKAIIDKATVTNTSAGNVTVSVNLVTVSTSASASNLIVDARVIAPNETYTLPELIGQVLQTGDFISTLCDTATAATIRVSGREIT